ncbi:low molecular weight protein-tyrosine-phosphatase [Raineyella fluvialis]|uniref:protein-tyrosine-phosphatase n=1 Tax=Raineyella fluvialis TaxID=2662261 RepID=A0A5Q2F7Z3_9ACTN|nr:low molecular weight protein-tyrosine-phosphatase [Raineyella fluvialis]QGF23090.1 low molecular weight phosphotyrosine protein phosphatase [Raineyella fluvialis]
MGLDVVFLCLGNICRSPMGERVALSHVRDTPWAGLVRVTSAGASAEEEGNPMDPRARAALTGRGYDGHTAHVAHRITEAEARRADLIVAAERRHLTALERRGIDLSPDRAVLLTSYVPGARAGSPLPDPWYGAAADFEDTLSVLEAAMPAFLTDLGRRLGGGPRS